MCYLTEANKKGHLRSKEVKRGSPANSTTSKFRRWALHFSLGNFHFPNLTYIIQFFKGFSMNLFSSRSDSPLSRYRSKLTQRDTPKAAAKIGMNKQVKINNFSLYLDTQGITLFKSFFWFSPVPNLYWLEHQKCYKNTGCQTLIIKGQILKKITNSEINENFSECFREIKFLIWRRK